MKTMLQKGKARLENCRGETITEVLVALLISVIGLTMLASMITASVHLIDKSKQSMSTYVGEANEIVRQDEDNLDENVTVQSERGTVQFTENNTPIKLTDTSADPSVPIEYYWFEMGDRKIISYKKG